MSRGLSVETTRVYNDDNHYGAKCRWSEWTVKGVKMVKVGAAVYAIRAEPSRKSSIATAREESKNAPYRSKVRNERSLREESNNEPDLFRKRRARVARVTRPESRTIIR